MKLEFSKAALDDLHFWKRSGKKAAQKVTELLLEIAETPFSGKGRPEQLVGNLSGYWSRRINMKDRIIYCVDEQAQTVFIRSARGHYE